MKDLGLWIISVSSYEDNGRLMQYKKVLMLPAVFLVLKSLALQAARTLHFGMDIFFINERMEEGEGYLDGIIADKRYGRKLVFLSAKTFELPRAIDVAVRLKRAGIDAVIGGAGITLADWKTYRWLIDSGITFNVGEGEETVGRIIEDALAGELKPVYWQRSYVNLRKAPVPVVPNAVSGGYNLTLSQLAGIDTSEGCPYNCSFCCVTALRGRKMTKERSRDSAAVLEWVERTHQEGLPIMLLDDNFRRSPVYRELSEELIKLNEKVNGALYFFIQLDAAPDVVEEIPILARIGIKQVFLGIETLDPATLAAEGKTHNQPEQYQQIADEFHKYGILINAGWMVGFSNQTASAILQEAAVMSKLFDRVALFRVVPLPGSQDFREAVCNEEIVNWDLNNYDAAHFVRKLYAMSISEARKICNKAFSVNHSIGHMLSGASGLRWRTFKSNLYSRIIAEWGRLLRGKPFHFLMDGIPRTTGKLAWRPQDSFRGFPLTVEDLERKESFLRGFI